MIATFIEWSRDGVGRLKVEETGEVLRVGASACGFLPEVGLTVDVLGIAPHPLGGNKAIALQLRKGTDSVALLDRAQTLPGLNNVDLFVEHTDAVGVLGVVVGAPIRSRVELRDWFARNGVDADFANPDRPLVRIGKIPWRIFVVNGEFPFGGQAVVTLSSNSSQSIRMHRETRGPPALVASEVGELFSFVQRCAANERAVIAHQAPGALWQASEWCAKPTLFFVSERDGASTLTGLAPFLMPDLFTKMQVSAEALHAAAGELVSLGESWRAAETLAGLRVVRGSLDWLELGE